MNLEGLPPVGGLLESSLTHWEGRVAAVLFLQGCNLACPACPVPHLVPRSEGKPEGRSRIPVEGALDAVFSRRQMLDGIVVAGGEPTLHESLPDLLEILRSFGLATRVRTNGTRPRALRRLVASGTVDSVALTLRAPLTGLYSVAAGMEPDLGGLYRSVEFLRWDPGDHEFRIVVDPRILTGEDVLRIGRTVSGARRVVLDPVAPGLPSGRTLRGLARRLGPLVRSVGVAGEPGRDYGREGPPAAARRAKAGRRGAA